MLLILQVLCKASPSSYKLPQEEMWPFQQPEAQEEAEVEQDDLL